MNKSLIFAAAAIAGLTLHSNAASADDWGCQVLLCVSGDWRGTPSCHPPMYKLIAAMKLPGFSWPTCPSANSSGARLERYEDCPAGWSPASGGDTGGDSGRQREDDICKRSLGVCSKASRKAASFAVGDGIETKYESYGHDGNQCRIVQTRPRKQREKPYYIEYTDAHDLRQRAWFNLNK